MRGLDNNNRCYAETIGKVWRQPDQKVLSTQYKRSCSSYHPNGFSLASQYTDVTENCVITPAHPINLEFYYETEYMSSTLYSDYFSCFTTLRGCIASCFSAGFSTWHFYLLHNHWNDLQKAHEIEYSALKCSLSASNSLSGCIMSYSIAPFLNTHEKISPLEFNWTSSGPSDYISRPSMYMLHFITAVV